MKFLSLVIVSIFPIVTFAGGSSVRGGGDLCENQIKIIRDDLAAWIIKGGPKDLKLPAGVSAAQYSQDMLSQISKAKILCVGAGDSSYPVQVYGTPKVCKFDNGFLSKPSIMCDRDNFMKMSESDQYVLVHHEYAGLTGIEEPTKDDSVYGVSNQISSFLVNQVVKRLSVKSPGQAINSPWRKLDGPEGADVARALQDAVAATNFSDCDVTPEITEQPALPVLCGGATYFYNRFQFVSKKNKGNGFNGIPVGSFDCDGNSSSNRFLMMSTQGGPALLNILDRNVYPNKGEENLHLRIDSVYELDTTGTKIIKVTITKSKVIQVNRGTIGNPRWTDENVPILSVACHGSN